jgi:hypothetical protein
MLQVPCLYTLTYGIETKIASVLVPPSPLPGYQFRCLTYPPWQGTLQKHPRREEMSTQYGKTRNGYSEIFLYISTNFGVDWSTPKPIVTSPVGSQNCFPTITVSPALQGEKSVRNQVNLIHQLFGLPA